MNSATRGVPVQKANTRRLFGTYRYRTSHGSIGPTSRPRRGLYVVSVDEKPIYVGLTKQPIRNRLRLGWNAKGETGYYGYAWRHHNENGIPGRVGSRRPSDRERMP